MLRNAKSESYLYRLAQLSEEHFEDPEKLKTITVYEIVLTDFNPSKDTQSKLHFLKEIHTLCYRKPHHAKFQTLPTLIVLISF